MDSKPPLVAWTTTRAYLLAGFCLVLGLCLGYVFHAPANSVMPATTTIPQAVTTAPLSSAQAPSGRLPLQNPPEVAAKAASSVIEELKTDPNNFDLLRQAGNIYMFSRVFSGAVSYYKHALDVRNDLTVRDDYANALYYSGDIDAALQQYALVLKADPGNDKALFNRGIVLWEAKNDPKGAVESWKTLLRLHPDHPRRAHIEEMIARASEHAQQQ